MSGAHEQWRCPWCDPADCGASSFETCPVRFRADGSPRYRKPAAERAEYIRLVGEPCFRCGVHVGGPAGARVGATGRDWVACMRCIGAARSRMDGERMAREAAAVAEALGSTVEGFEYSYGDDAA